MTINASTTALIRAGHFILCGTVLFFALGTYATLFSHFLPPPNLFILDVISTDTHYKYFALFIVPTTAYFVIANWVGWQFYRNS